MELDEADQQTSWRADGNKTVQLEKHILKNVLLKLIQRRTGANKGDYLPLSVYEARGFNPTLIELECTNTKVLPGLGLCYKLWIGREMCETTDQQCCNKPTEMRERRNKPS